MQQKGNKNKPVFVVKSTRMGGLDYLHISLIALVIVLIGLAFALSYFKPGAVLQGCQYGVQNNTCVTPEHNSSQVMQALGRVLASYSTSNSSLSLLSYYSLVNQTSLSYLPASSQWVAVVPYINPFVDNETQYVSFVFNGNLQLNRSFISMLNPSNTVGASTVAFGTLSIDSRSLCKYSSPIPAYFITDPYVPGFIGYLDGAINLSRQYGDINMSYYFISSNYAASKYQQYGTSYTQNLNRYLACASQQKGFPSFVSNLSIAYTGEPLPNSTLSEMVMGSGLNGTAFSACLSNSSGMLASQTTLAQFYGVTSVPAYIINCKYESIPNTATSAIDYALRGIK